MIDTRAIAYREWRICGSRCRSLRFHQPEQSTVDILHYQRECLHKEVPRLQKIRHRSHISVSRNESTPQNALFDRPLSPGDKKHEMD